MRKIATLTNVEFFFFWLINYVCNAQMQLLQGKQLKLLSNYILYCFIIELITEVSHHRLAATG